MNFKILTTLLIFTSNLYANNAQLTSAFDIVKKVYNSNRPKTSKFLIEMKIEDSSGVSERKFYSLNKTNQIDDSEVLVKFITPAKYDNISLLTKNKASASSDQWMYLPALKKERRIDSSSKSGRFVGSDIYYIDFENRRPDRDSHKLISKSSNLAVIESIPKEKDVYSKVVSTIDLEKFVVTKAEFFINGKVNKIYSAEKLKKDNDIWFVEASSVKNLEINSKTSSKILNFKFNDNLESNYFNQFKIGDKIKKLFK